MTEPVQMSEEPAQRPRPAGLMIGLFGTLFWGGLVAAAFIWPDGKSTAKLGLALVPLAGVFLGTTLWELHRRLRDGPYHPRYLQTSGEATRFRFDGPADSGFLGAFLMCPIAFLPIAGAEWLAGPLPVMAALWVPLPFIALAFGVGFLLSRRTYAGGHRDFVLAKGTLTIPPRRWTDGRFPSEDVEIRNIAAVILQSGRVALRTTQGAEIPKLDCPGLYETAYLRGRWLADLLGVPLVHIRVHPQPMWMLWRFMASFTFLWFYVMFVVGSFVHELRIADRQPALSRLASVVPAFDNSKQTQSLITIAYDNFPPSSDEFRPPVLILHGSPGRAQELGDMARAFQSYGYRVITPDLPGFGDSTRDPPSLSILSHAHEMLAVMDQLRIPRAHIIGWSLGGGVGMHMADLAPDRIASLTLMASVSDQQVEGTRSYFAEHMKYAAGYAAATFVRYAIPHFGYLSRLDDIRASMRNFWDTDMRPLTGIMRRMQVPTMILHGRHDFLVPPFAAEHSHELIGPSRLVITEHSHFYPFLQPEIAAAHIRPLLARHDEPGVPALRQRADLSPEGPPLLGAFGRWVELALRRAHWLTLVAAGVLVLLWKFRTGAVLLFLAVAAGLIDNGIAFGALIVVQAGAAARAYVRGRRLAASHAPRIIGRGTSARTPSHWRDILERRPIRAALATRLVPRELETAFEAAGFHRLVPIRFAGAVCLAWCLWMVMYFAATVASFAFVVSPLMSRLGVAGLVVGVGLTVPVVRGAELLLTRHGRRRMRMWWTRLTHREYWPAELLYWPMAPFYIAWGLRHGPIAFTACNPGIEGGGGVIGESKKAILDAMPEAAPWILQSVRIDRGSPQARAAEAMNAIASHGSLGFPVILKPDAGYRGFAVKLARSEQDVRDYFRVMHAPAIVQEYHPGPRECGILWARNVESSGDGLAGRIYSVTRKTFPVLSGDGRRTLEDLIHRHPRFHAQAGVFLERWAADRERVLSSSETLRLAESGNHCQGTLFSDGEDLITPELTARIDAIARSLRGGLDIGRFDLRYESDETLRRGEGFKIIELNGVTGESTNIYDPGRSLAWAFRVAIGQWRLMYRLGAERMRAGHRPLPVRELFRRIREHKRSRSGTALAD